MGYLELLFSTTTWEMLLYLPWKCIISPYSPLGHLYTQFGNHEPDGMHFSDVFPAPGPPPPNNSGFTDEVGHDICFALVRKQNGFT